MEITRTQLLMRLESNDRDRLRVLSANQIVVFQFEDRIFLLNRVTTDAFEVVPDYVSGITMVAI